MTFEEQFIREKKAERAFEKLVLAVDPYINPAGKHIEKLLTDDMIQIMAADTCTHYNIPPQIAFMYAEAFIKMTHALISYGYAIGLHDFAHSTNAHES